MIDTDGDGFGDEVINEANNDGRADALLYLVVMMDSLNINLLRTIYNNLLDSQLKL